MSLLLPVNIFSLVAAIVIISTVVAMSSSYILKIEIDNNDNSSKKITDENIISSASNLHRNIAEVSESLYRR
jgi:hypothetical protein